MTKAAARKVPMIAEMLLTVCANPNAYGLNLFGVISWFAATDTMQPAFCAGQGRLSWDILGEHTAIPVRQLPPMMVYILVADEEIKDPANPRAQPTTMNHFFPSLSVRDPKMGPQANVRRKLLLAIQLALAAPPTLITWNLMVVLVVFEKVAQQFASESAKMAMKVRKPTE